MQSHAHHPDAQRATGVDRLVTAATAVPPSADRDSDESVQLDSALSVHLAATAQTDGKDAVIALLAGGSLAPVLAERFAELDGSPEAPPSTLPDISSELLPWVLRGAADSDYPDPGAVSALVHPVLILAEAGDPGHPESTARRLHDLLPQSELHIASHLPEMRAWGERIDTFLN